ncbi:hypothetical protein NHX12_013506 [Muraenolepis orangiensis]|uniref:Uncharacterized protein n=1 Tax=Muraenolepis orangiensis TaxID=630683 RepID=A0A9Q0DGB8_9TELE|nr:hypothetical protein NHX12_013506 [Muraenolepis orangiensis]
MEGDDVSLREQLFHNRVRETIICVLLFTCLYIVSYFILTHFKKNAEFVTDDVEDATVNKIALWLCTFTLSVAVCAVLLLPISILSNQVLITFPQSYYVRWLNGSLIRGLWNLVFLFSNLSLVFLMPFAYFFTESEGFAGSKKGVMARVYEAVVLLVLLVLLVLGMVWVASALLHHNMARESLYDLWEYYLPYFYSGISLFGVMLLLLCTPFGLARMFSVTGSFLVKPRLLENIEDTLSCTIFEEVRSSSSCWVQLNLEGMKQEYRSVTAKRFSLEMRRKASPWQRNLGYPLAMLLLLALTVVCVLMVCFNVLQLLFDETALPRGMEDPRLGTSFSMFGSLGAAVQVVLILYLMVSSVVGFYSSPLFIGLLPHDTSVTQVDDTSVTQVDDTSVTQVDDTSVTQVDYTTLTQVYDTTLTQVDDTSVTQVDDTTLTQVDDTSVTQVDDTSLTQVDDTTLTQVDNTTLTQVDNTTLTQVDTTTLTQVDTTTLTQVDTTTLTQVDTTTLTQVDTTTLTQVDTTTLTQVDTTTLTQVDTTTLTQVDTTTLTQVDTTTLTQVDTTTLTQVDTTTLTQVDTTTLTQVDTTTLTQVDTTTLTQVDTTTLTQVDTTTLTQVDNITLTQVDNITLTQVDNTTLTQVDNTTLTQVDNTTITQVDNTTITQVDNTTITQVDTTLTQVDTTLTQVDNTTLTQVDTTITQIIGNCVSLLILSSALPVFSRTIGITRFDLLGDFGRYNWLGNFYVVFLYNMMFAGLTSASLIKTVTWAVQRELIRAFGLHRLPLTVSRSTVPFRLLLASGLSKIQ